jgi:predicted ester cyclase
MMSQRFRIDGVEYDIETLTQEGRDLVARLTFARLQQQEMSNQMAVLTKAKNAYIADLKTEIIQGRTGVDLSALFSDD